MAATRQLKYRRTSLSARRGLLAIAAVSGVAAALSPARPTGSRPADVLWCALLGGAFPLIASRSKRWPLLWTGWIAAIVGIGGDITGKIGTIALLIVLALMTFAPRRDRFQAALLGALAVNVLLRGPSYGFVGLPTIVAVIALAPVVVSGFQMAHGRERRVGLVVAATLLAAGVILGAVAGLAAMQARTDLQAGADSATAGLDQVRAGATGQATDSFDTAARHFRHASGPLDGWMTWGGRLVPVVGRHVDALRTVASSGVALSESAATTSSTSDYRTLTATDGTVDLAQVDSLADPVAQSAEVIQASLDSVAAVRSPWLIPQVGEELSRFEDKLSDAGDQAGIAAEALQVTPSLLGGDRARHYFLAFATPGESRNGGGFVGAFGILTADAGHLELTEAGNLNALNPVSDPYSFEPPADWQERYGSYYVQYFLGNLAAGPDWPTDRDVISQLYPQAPGGMAIDGLIYVDPAAIAGLLRLTGPVQIPELGVSLNADNAEKFLLQDQYVLIDGNNPQRKELLGDAARATFDALTSRPLPGISTLTDALGGLVAAGHLRLSVEDTTAESFLDRVGLSGRWQVTPGSDYLSARWANLLPNKIDSFIHRDIDVASTVDPSAGMVTERVTVTVHNDAPASGLPSYVVGNKTGLPEGTSQNLLTVHSPHALESVTIDGETVDSVTQVEFGGPVYSTMVEVPPGGTRTVVFDLRGAVPAWPYRFEAIPQTMANPDGITVRIDGVPSSEEPLKFSGPFVDTVKLGSPLVTERAIG